MSFVCIVTWTHNVVSQEVKMVLFRVATNQSPPSEWFLPLTNCPAARKDNNVPMSQSHSETDVSQQWESSQNETAEMAQNISLPAEDFARLSTLFSRIKQGLTDSPEIFVPACQRMLNNAKNLPRQKQVWLVQCTLFLSIQGCQQYVACASAPASMPGDVVASKLGFNQQLSVDANFSCLESAGCLLGAHLDGVSTKYKAVG